MLKDSARTQSNACSAEGPPSAIISGVRLHDADCFISNAMRRVARTA